MDIKKPEGKKQWALTCCIGVIIIFVILVAIGYMLGGGTTNITNATDNDKVTLDFKVPSFFEKSKDAQGVWEENPENGNYFTIVVVSDTDNSYHNLTKELYTNTSTYSCHNTDKENIYFGIDTNTPNGVTYFEIFKKDNHNYLVYSTGSGDNRIASFTYLNEFNELNNIKPIVFNI